MIRNPIYIKQLNDCYGLDQGIVADMPGGPIFGGGTLNYLAKFTPDGLNIGDSQIFDDGTSIGINNSTPSTKARLDVHSTTQGMLTPRMTTAQRDLIAPGVGDKGLLIYNTDTALFNYWDGTAWQSIDSSAVSEWLIDGNTNGAVKYIGTNDNYDFPIYTNGAEAMRIKSTGNVGIGTSAPGTTKLQVNQTSYNDVAFFRGFFGGSFDAMKIDANGNVIDYAYTNPQLGIALGTSPSYLTKFITAPNDWGIEFGNFTLSNDSVNSTSVYKLGYDNLAFRDHNNADVMNIKGGTVSIGTNAPDASSIFEVASTIKCFRLKPMTAAQASLITPAEGSIVIVSTTDATFTAVGIWCYYGGAWTQL